MDIILFRLTEPLNITTGTASAVVLESNGKTTTDAGKRIDVKNSVSLLDHAKRGSLGHAVWDCIKKCFVVVQVAHDPESPE